MTNKEFFWNLIDAAKDPDQNAMLSKLERALSEQNEKDIVRFRACLGAYVEWMHNCIWLDMACALINGEVSDDTALFFNLWLIGQGEKTLLDTLKDPDSLSQLPDIAFGGAFFEGLMTAGYKEEHGSDFYGTNALRAQIVMEIAPDIAFRGGDKFGVYDTLEEALDDIPNILPKLIERAKRAGFIGRG